MTCAYFILQHNLKSIFKDRNEYLSLKVQSREARLLGQNTRVDRDWETKYAHVITVSL